MTLDSWPPFSPPPPPPPAAPLSSSNSDVVSVPSRADSFTAQWIRADNLDFWMYFRISVSLLTDCCSDTVE